MDNQELDSLLERLHEELNGAAAMDEKGQELLRQIDADIQALLGETGSSRTNADLGVIRQIQESINRLEATHPRLTAVLSDIVNSLSNAGI